MSSETETDGTVASRLAFVVAFVVAVVVCGTGWFGAWFLFFRSSFGVGTPMRDAWVYFSTGMVGIVSALVFAVVARGAWLLYRWVRYGGNAS